MGFFGEIFSGHKLPRERKGPTDVDAILNRVALELPRQRLAVPEQLKTDPITQERAVTNSDFPAQPAVQETDKADHSFLETRESQSVNQAYLEPAPVKRNSHPRTNISSLTAKVPIYTSR